MLTPIARMGASETRPAILAALACPTCGGTVPVTWTYTPREGHPYLDCECQHCTVQWSLRVTPEQLLRITLLGMLGRLPL